VYIIALCCSLNTTTFFSFYVCPVPDPTYYPLEQSLLSVRLSDAHKESFYLQHIVDISKMSLIRARRIGDEHSWVVPLNTNGVEPSTMPDYVIDFAAFDISVKSESFAHYDIQARSIKSFALKHQHVFPDVRDEKRRFEDRTIMGMRRLPKAQQPDRSSELFTQNPGYEINGPRWSIIEDWTPPEGSGWVYYDDEMLEILKMKHPDLAAYLAKTEMHGTKRGNEDNAPDTEG
jgi:hypothetical protein